MKETSLMRSIRFALNEEPGVRVWRNNVGGGRLASGHWVDFGLCAGSADLIGIARGRFLSVEVKAPGAKTSRARKESQALWRDTVLRFGGLATSVTSVAEAVAFVRSGVFFVPSAEHLLLAKVPCKG